MDRDARQHAECARYQLAELPRLLVLPAIGMIGLPSEDRKIEHRTRLPLLDACRICRLGQSSPAASIRSVMQ